MTKEQTAVEWLMSKLALRDNCPFQAIAFYQDNKEFVEQAKAMEKKQLSKSYHKGVRHEWEGAGGNFQDFYEETYGNGTSI